MTRIERVTSPLPRECSTTEPHGQKFSQDKKNPQSIYCGAGEGNRTLVISLEGFCTTIVLHPPEPRESPPAKILVRYIRRSDESLGGGGWIRTIVGVSQQIYSLPPLATRAPLRSERLEL